MEKFLSSILLLLCSFLLIQMNRKYKKMCLRKVRLDGLNAFFFDMMFDVTLYVFLTNYLFPVCTHIIYGFSVIEQENVTPLELTMVYIIETSSWWLFYHTFFLLCKRNTVFLSYKIESNKSLELIAAFLLVLYFVSRMATLGVQEDEPTALEQRLFFIIPFVNLAGYMLAIFITFAGNKYFSNWLWMIAVAATGAFFIGAFLGGIRGAIVTPVVWAAYVIYKLRPAKVRKKFYVAFAIVLFGFSLIQPIFMGFRVMNSENISLEKKIDMAITIEENRSMQNTDSRYEAKNLLREMDYRYGAQGTAAQSRE